MSHNTESRKEWLNSLKVGTRVTVKTQIRTYDGAIEAIKKIKFGCFLRWETKPIQRSGLIQRQETTLQLA